MIAVHARAGGKQDSRADVAETGSVGKARAVTRGHHGQPEAQVLMQSLFTSRRLLSSVLACVSLVSAGAVHAQSLSAQQAAATQSTGQADGVQSVQGTTQQLPRLSGRSGSNGGNGQAQAMRAQAGAPVAAPINAAVDGGNVSELQRRIASKELAELRTVYNGSYGASLLMATNETTYYVALFERKNFWRVVKTTDIGRAEAVFRDFAQQTVDLASAEIRSVQLAAQRSQTEALIDVSKERASRIQADLAIQQAQQEAVNERQRQAQAQMAQLSEETRTAQAQLAELQRQVADLQRQQNAGLPSSSGTPVNAASSRSRRLK